MSDNDAAPKSAAATTARSEFEGSINIFSVLIGVALIVKIAIQAVQSKKTVGLDPSIPTQDNPTGTNSSKINGQADSTLGTYGWCLFWLVCMWITVISVLSRRYLSRFAPKELSVWFYSIPYLFAISLVIWTLIQTNTYHKKINTNQVPIAYSNFSIGGTVMLGFMVAVLYGLSNKIMTCPKNEEGLTIIIAWIAIGLGIAVVGMTVQTELLLTSFTTDG
jgi:hypothetical protein